MRLITTLFARDHSRLLGLHLEGDSNRAEKTLSCAARSKSTHVLRLELTLRSTTVVSNQQMETLGGPWDMRLQFVTRWPRETDEGKYGKLSCSHTAKETLHNRKTLAIFLH
jgi:hypothetical protein